MYTLLSGRNLYLALSFSKYLLASSLLLGVILLLSAVPIAIILLLKILFYTIIYILQHENSLKQKLCFYKNLGVSKVTLFLVAFIIDFTITIVSNLILLKF